jgi:hypothetical protein
MKHLRDQSPLCETGSPDRLADLMRVDLAYEVLQLEIWTLGARVHHTARLMSPTYISSYPPIR